MSNILILQARKYGYSFKKYAQTTPSLDDVSWSYLFRINNKWFLPWIIVCVLLEQSQHLNIVMGISVRSSEWWNSVQNTLELKWQLKSLFCFCMACYYSTVYSTYQRLVLIGRNEVYVYGFISNSKSKLFMCNIPGCQLAIKTTRMRFSSDNLF
jgi:hypothetical protein